MSVWDLIDRHLHISSALIIAFDTRMSADITLHWYFSIYVDWQLTQSNLNWRWWDDIYHMFVMLCDKDETMRRWHVQRIGSTPKM